MDCDIIKIVEEIDNIRAGLESLSDRLVKIGLMGVSDSDIYRAIFNVTTSIYESAKILFIEVENPYRDMAHKYGINVGIEQNEIDKRGDATMNQTRQRILRNAILVHIARTIKVEMRDLKHLKQWLNFDLQDIEGKKMFEQIMSAEIKRLEDRVI